MAYNVAQFSALEENADGSAVMAITHTGNAGEPVRVQRIPFVTSIDTDAETIRRLVIPFQLALNKTRSFIIGATPNVGQNVDTTTPLPSTPASTFGSFCAASAAFSPPATPTDVWTITGSASRIVQINRIIVNTVQTTAGLNGWFLIKRSTANTNGTSALVTAVPTDKAFPAATGTVRQYTANPSALGTTIGNIWTGRIMSPQPTAAFTGDLERVIYGDGLKQAPIVLSGINDVLALNFGGAALPPGLSVQVTVNFTES